MYTKKSISKIAYIIPPTLMGRQNGIINQALTWSAGLKNMGVSVDLVSPWESYQWSSYDLIHSFGIGHYLNMLPQLRELGARKFVVSPIYDSNRQEFISNLISRLSLPVGEMRTTMATMRAIIPHVDKIFVRSEFESRKISSIFGVKRDKILNVPLALRFETKDISIGVPKEPICCHVSVLSAPIKNVDRLVQAAIKYQFPLHLAGQIKSDGFRSHLESITRKYSNVIYHGVLSDDELKMLYARSRVFALPSLMEGVGLVGLEAAAYGADIVITERGGPKEYYQDMKLTVDPESIDEIGKAVMHFLKGNTFQPSLSQFVLGEYSIEGSANKLLNAYRSLV